MKLSDRQVADIRQAFKNGASYQRLARRYKVSPETIGNIVRNATHPNPEYEPPLKKPFDVKFAQRLRSKGVTYREIARAEGERSKRGNKPYCGESVRLHLRKAGQN